MATLVSVLLLLLDVLVVALVLQLVVLGLLRLLRLARGGGRPRPRVAEAPTGFGEPGSVGGTARKRRCDDCRSGWVGQPGTDASVMTLRFRRSARRRARSRRQPPPAWAAKQGWERCPSCFSSAVRDSRHQGDTTRP